MFSSQCYGRINANDGEGKAGLPEEVKDARGQAISEVYPALLLPQTITNSQG